MKKYYRLMLGKGSMYAKDCYAGNFIGVDFGINIDLTGRFHQNWREFNKEFIPIYLVNRPQKKKIAAGLACATIWVVCYSMKVGDIILCPNGSGGYMVAEAQSDYIYNSGQLLPHRRTVKWYPVVIERSGMSDGLRHSTGAIGTYCELTRYSEEIESLIGGQRPPVLVSTDETITDPSEFAVEKHLEEFLVCNWSQTELGRHYDIYEEEGELVGQQYPTDTGQVDILAISKDKRKLLVVELKKGRASDNVVGQIQRYMGYVKEELAEPNQTVHGVIIALDDDLRIKRALSVTNNIEFYRYQVSFKLMKNS
jgi:restriction system protein